MRIGRACNCDCCYGLYCVKEAGRREGVCIELKEGQKPPSECRPYRPKPKPKPNPEESNYAPSVPVVGDLSPSNENIPDAAKPSAPNPSVPESPPAVAGLQPPTAEQSTEPPATMTRPPKRPNSQGRPKPQKPTSESNNKPGKPNSQGKPGKPKPAKPSSQGSKPSGSGSGAGSSGSNSIPSAGSTFPQGGSQFTPVGASSPAAVAPAAQLPFNLPNNPALGDNNDDEDDDESTHYVPSNSNFGNNVPKPPNSTNN